MQRSGSVASLEMFYNIRWCMLGVQGVQGFLGFRFRACGLGLTGIGCRVQGLEIFRLSSKNSITLEIMVRV